MAMTGLVDYIQTELRTKPSLIMDGKALREKIGIADLPITRRNCNLLAELASKSGAARLSTVEFFQRADTGESMCFMIFAQSLDAHATAVTELQSMVISDAQVKDGEPAAINPHIVVLHPHDCG